MKRKLFKLLSIMLVIAMAMPVPVFAEEGAYDTGEGANYTEEGSNDTGEGANDAEEGSNDAEEGANDTEEGANDTEEGSNDTEEGSNDTEEGSNDTEEGSNDTEEGSNDTEEGSNDTDPVVCEHENVEIKNAKDATCTEAGYTGDTICLDCGETVKAGEAIPATGHSWVDNGESTATCTENGYQPQICSVCGSTRNKPVSATGHTEEVVPGKAATCTEPGLTDGKKCSVCGEIIVAQEEIPATGHSWVDDGECTATCTENGIQPQICSVCGSTRNKPVSATGHSWVDNGECTATCTEDGYQPQICSVCGSTRNKPVSATGHTEEVVPGKAATCTEPGLTDGKKCSVCGEIIVAQEVIPATGHSWVDNGECTATCTENGIQPQICSVCGSVRNKIVFATGHTEEIVPGKAATCTEPGLTDGKKCSVCGEILVAQQEIPATGHTEEVVPGKAATCTEPGLTDGKKCSVCGEILVAQEEIPATGHTPAEAVRENEVAATETEDGSYDSVVYCSVCGAELSRETVTIPATGGDEECVHEHTELQNVKAATCTEEGYTGDLVCLDCGETVETGEVIPALGHTFGDWTETKAATANTAGEKERICSVCGYKETAVIPALGGGSSGGGGGGGGSSSYAITIPSVDNGKVTASSSSAVKGTTVTFTVSADDGYELSALTVTDAKGNELTLTDKGNGKYAFTMPASRVTVSATFKEAEDEQDSPETGFTDVDAAQYYYEAVEWAVENGIATGATSTTFSPEVPCTRAQMVTFLWRAAGSPTPNDTANPFADVESGEYYYDAVLWAVEKGVTNGTSDTAFSPNVTVTRGQIVSFLYRYAGSPAVSGSNDFTDVAADAYYADAIQWAVNNNVTNGTSTATFEPESDCTRAQIVTFLYRGLAA